MIKSKIIWNILLLISILFGIFTGCESRYDHHNNPWMITIRCYSANDSSLIGEFTTIFELKEGDLLIDYADSGINGKLKTTYTKDSVLYISGSRYGEPRELESIFNNSRFQFIISKDGFNEVDTLLYGREFEESQDSLLLFGVSRKFNVYLTEE